MTDAGVAAPSRLSRLLPHGIAAWLRLLVAVWVIGFLVYYVGPRTIGATLFKVVAAVGISAAFFIAANKLFDLTYTAWTWFCTIAGFAVGFAAFAVLDGDQVLRELPAGLWLWGLIGGVVVGGAMFVLTALVPDDEAAGTNPMRLTVAVAAFAADRRAPRRRRRRRRPTGSRLVQAADLHRGRRASAAAACGP